MGLFKFLADDLLGLVDYPDTKTANSNLKRSGTKRFDKLTTQTNWRRRYGVAKRRVSQSGWRDVSKPRQSPACRSVIRPSICSIAFW